MAGPKTSNQTADLCGYTSEVTGRLYGLAKAETYITDSAKRSVLKDVADKIDATLQALFNLLIARITLRIMTHRRNLGEGRAIDRAFDKHVAHCAESIRTGPAGGSRDNAPYVAVFDEGTAPFQSPTIREDAELAEELRRRLAKLDDFPTKQSLLDDNAKLEALIGPASAAVTGGEKKISKDFTTEVEARQAVIDAIWLGKKAVEMTFKRDRNPAAPAAGTIRSPPDAAVFRLVCAKFPEISIWSALPLLSARDRISDRPLTGGSALDQSAQRTAPDRSVRDQSFKRTLPGW